MNYDPNTLFVPNPAANRPNLDSLEFAGLPKENTRVKMWHKVNGRWVSANLPVDRHINDGRGHRFYEEQGWILENEFKRMMVLEREAEKAALEAVVGPKKGGRPFKDPAKQAAKQLENLKELKEKETDMTENENKQELIKNLVDDARANKKGELTQKEVKGIEKFVTDKVMKKIYEQGK